jgi:GTP-binding protein YchF
MRIGIIGLPQSGKTTVFNTLTGAHGDTGGYHAGAQVAIGVVRVPDPRLATLSEIFEPDKTVPDHLEFEDIGGAFAHLAGGEGSGRALAALRECDAVLMVLRAFEAEFVVEVLGALDPLREYETMEEELLLADLQVIENRLQSIEADLRKAAADRDALQHEEQALEKCRAAVEEEKGLRQVTLTAAEEKLLRHYAFLTLKPRICSLNIGERHIRDAGVPSELADAGVTVVPICAELEMELMELSEEERRAFMEDAGLDQLAAGRLIEACREALGLRAFYTCAGKTVQAWSVPGGTDARSAAGKIHTDMEKGFIRAEVVAFYDLAECGSVKEARSRGKLRMEGKEYEVQDGDVITFHFSR